MSYCINPKCQKPRNEESAPNCDNCGASLVLGDRYRALKLIGQGGFGRTFLAVDESHPSKPRCVIKQFLPPNISTLAASQLFREEAERLKSLGSHPQIPTFLDYLEIDEQRYIIQEFIDGSNLEQELEETGAFDEGQIRQLLNDILPVLEFVHNHSVIHRDIKPENIIRRVSDRRLTLVDFGAAKYAATGTALIKTGTTIGSAGYTAPEQLMGKAVFQSDFYSLGVTCIHLLTQVPPFDLVDSAEGSWVWRDYLSAPVSKQLGSILDKLLERGTRKRYISALAVMSDLTAKSSAQPIVISSVDALEKECKPLRSKIVAVGVASVVGVSTLAGIRFGAVYLFNWVNQPLVVHAPQPQTQPRLVPVPKTSPSPQILNPQKQPKFEEEKLIEMLDPLVSNLSRVFGAFAVLAGLTIGIREYSQGGEYQRGFSLAATGLMMSITMSLLWNLFISNPASVQPTSAIKIQQAAVAPKAK